MKSKSIYVIYLIFCVIFFSGSSFGASFYTACPNDPGAVYLTKDNFPLSADGIADDSDAIQEAIDQASTSSASILFVPEGTYRLGKRINVWAGVRVIGYGEKRPVFLLGENTPGFQEEPEKYMVFFSGGRAGGGFGGFGGPRRGGPRGGATSVQDGSAGTFYCAMSNIDFEIEDGNPAAIAIRFHVAQHSYLSHMNFKLGTAKAGLDDIGNEVEDLHFYGGQYGIITGTSAPSWPILVIDCTFEGQSEAGISCDVAGLAIVRPQFKNVPTAVSIVPNKSDELWISDARFENISGPAVIISNEHNARTQINLQNIACKNVPALAKFRESNKTIQGKGDMYVVEQFSHGLHIEKMGLERQIKTTFVAKQVSALPDLVKSDIASIPEADTWVNVTKLGIIGDNQTDNTVALKEAIAKHRVLYFPAGWYNVSDTLILKPDTVLIGLNPSVTVINLPNNTDAFQGTGEPKPLIETPKNGTNIITGIGIYTNAINPRAVGIKWMAGANSMMNDVRMHGGHGTTTPRPAGGGRGGRGGFGFGFGDFGQANRESWDSQPASLWVTDGGGGTFKDIWTPSPYTKSGMLITDTSTSGRLYAMSAEHHVSNEMVIRNVSNWKFFALQFEEEREEGPKALPLEIENSRNIQFGNVFFYRVISCFVPFPYAAKVNNSGDIRFRNVHCYSNSRVSFDGTLYDASSGIEVRDPEYAVMDVLRDSYSARPVKGGRIIADGAKVEKLADGFLNIASATMDNKGQLYFTDPRELHIYRWSQENKKAEIVRDIPQRPVQLAFDKSGNLLVVAYEGNGTVLSFNPDEKDSEIVTLQAQPAELRPDAVPILALSRWTSDEAFMRDATTQKQSHFVSPDGSVFIPAGRDFMTGSTSWGIKMADILRTFRIAPAVKGQLFYATNEAEVKTWSFRVEPDGTLSDAKLFAQEGGESLAVDYNGNVYIAAGQIMVFNPEGDYIDTIEVPERPTSFVFGGKDKKTLYITARTSLYSVRIK